MSSQYRCLVHEGSVAKGRGGDFHNRDNVGSSKPVFLKGQTRTPGGAQDTALGFQKKMLEVPFT